MIVIALWDQNFFKLRFVPSACMSYSLTPKVTKLFYSFTWACSSFNHMYLLFSKGFSFSRHRIGVYCAGSYGGGYKVHFIPPHQLDFSIIFDILVGGDSNFADLLRRPIPSFCKCLGIIATPNRRNATRLEKKISWKKRKIHDSKKFMNQNSLKTFSFPCAENVLRHVQNMFEVLRGLLSTVLMTLKCFCVLILTFYWEIFSLHQIQ